MTIPAEVIVGGFGLMFASVVVGVTSLLFNKKKVAHKLKISKCCLCSSRKGNVEKISRNDIHTNTYYYFHPECVERIIWEPDGYSNQVVDLTLEISSLLTKEKMRVEKEKYNQTFRLENSLVKKYILQDRFLDRLGINIEETMKEEAEKNE